MSTKILRLFGLLIFLFPAAIFSQEAEVADTDQNEVKAWKKGGMGTLTFNQVGLFNWAAGGQSNITLIGNLNAFANYKKGKTTGENTLELAYGFIKNNFIYNPGAPITKAEDKIDFISKWGKEASWGNGKISYAALLHAWTQFTAGFANPGDPVYISKFAAPAYAELAIGLDYKPNEKLSIFFSPVSGKFTLVADDSLAGASAYGVNTFDAENNRLPGAFQKTRYEFGATFRAKYKADIMENIGLESQLGLFSNYIYNPQNIDVRWTNAIVAKINKYVTVNLFTDLIYDHDIFIPLVDGQGLPLPSINPVTNTPYLDQSGNPIQRKGPRIQFKEVFGIGLGYKF